MYPNYPNFTCVFPLCLSIFMHNIWDMKQTDVGGGCNFKVITFDYIYLFFLKKNSLKMSAKCAQQCMVLTHHTFCVQNLLSL